MRRAVLLVLAACSANPDPVPPQPAPSASAIAPGKKLEPIDGMVIVPAGPFLRGSPDGVGSSDERPQKEITMSAFYVDKTEVTQKAYAKCVEAKKCKAPQCSSDRKTDWDPDKRGDHPVVCIHWKQAKAYCEFAGKRLPTEAEWEKAARGTDGRRYPWGEDPPDCELAQYYGCNTKDTLPVGSLPKGASPYGALDMAGNVWEWIADWYDSGYYKVAPAQDPPGPKRGDEKPVRGGSWKYGKKDLDVAPRTFEEPMKAYEHVGVRCAKSP
jgi:formylglycine-generating enzyme required for sulfatase activity